MSQTIDYIQKGIKEFFASKAKCKALSKAEYEEKPTHTLCISGIEEAFGNAVLQLPTPFAKEQEICTILDLFKQKELPFFWWEPPIPIGLEEKKPANEINRKNILFKHGLQAGGLLKGICAHLPAIDVPISLSTRISIRKIESFADLKLFCHLFFPIHGAESHTIEQIYALMEQMTQEEVNYFAYQEGRPVGGITLATGQETAGLWNFTVLPDYRRQGIGSALIQTALIEAQTLGYQNVMSVLMPSEMRKVWHQFHFQEMCYFPFYIGPGKLAQTKEEKSKKIREKRLL